MAHPRHHQPVRGLGRDTGMDGGIAVHHARLVVVARIDLLDLALLRRHQLFLRLDVEFDALDVLRELGGRLVLARVEVELLLQVRELGLQAADALVDIGHRALVFLERARCAPGRCPSRWCRWRAARGCGCLLPWRSARASCAPLPRRPSSRALRRRRRHRSASRPGLASSTAPPAAPGIPAARRRRSTSCRPCRRSGRKWIARLPPAAAARAGRRGLRASAAWIPPGKCRCPRF